MTGEFEAFHAVMQTQEQIDRRQSRHRTHQLEFHVARQIAEMRRVRNLPKVM